MIVKQSDESKMSLQTQTHSKTAVFSSPHHPLRMTQYEIPTLKTQEILVKNEYTTLCRSDLNTFSGKRREKCPTILGHEIVGRIVAMGEDAPQTDFRGTPLGLGDRVTWSIFASNPESELSRQGMPQKAEGLFKYGHEQITSDSTLHGGLSQYCILRPHTTIIKIDEVIPLPVAATINCAGATVAGALRLAENVQGKTVAVSGVGMLGIIACAMCRMNGAKRIIAMDTSEERLETAQSFGAHETRLVNRQDGSTTSESITLDSNIVDVLLEFSGRVEAMESTLALLAIGGKVLWVGATYPQPAVRIDAESIVRRLLTLKGLHNYNGQDLQTAVEFIETHHLAFPWDKLVCDRFTLDQAQEAFRYALESNPHRVGILIGE
jgi:putative phosphonate catabolism associated alcohol dehydrogenase